jgi:hypothetical protein
MPVGVFRIHNVSLIILKWKQALSVSLVQEHIRSKPNIFLNVFYFIYFIFVSDILPYVVAAGEASETVFCCLSPKDIRPYPPSFGCWRTTAVRGANEGHPEAGAR